MKHEETNITGKYILIGQTPVECPDVIEWGRWFETNDRRVAFSKVGDVYVSTVFLGRDYAFHGLMFPERPHTPILFETLAWRESGKDREWLALQERCSTWPEAETQHARVVAEIAAEQPGATVERLDVAETPTH